MTGIRPLFRILSAALLAATTGGCAIWQPPWLGPLPQYGALPVDQLMSCEAMTASFVYSAKRAARIEYWLQVGPLPGYGFDMFGVDAPLQLIRERERLDALTDLQRMRGCPVMDPGPAVVYERQKLEQEMRGKMALLQSKG